MAAKRLRGNPKVVNSVCAQYLAIHRVAVKERWSHSRYVAYRAGVADKTPELTTGDANQIFQYRRALWDVFWTSAEWRLGHVEITTALARSCSEWPANNRPTHGGHFWAGTDILFDKWEPLTSMGTS